MIELRTIPKEIPQEALAPGIRRAARCLSRGQGKSTLAAHILRRCLDPGDALHRPGKEYILLAQSLEGQGWCSNRCATTCPNNGDYRIADSTTRMGIRHIPTGTTLRLSLPKANQPWFGANNPLVVADEPGLWEINSIMNQALDTSLGKLTAT